MNRYFIETFIYGTQELAWSIGDKQSVLLHFFHVSKFPSLPMFFFRPLFFPLSLEQIAALSRLCVKERKKRELNAVSE